MWTASGVSDFHGSPVQRRELRRERVVRVPVALDRLRPDVGPEPLPWSTVVRQRERRVRQQLAVRVDERVRHQLEAVEQAGQGGPHGVNAVARPLLDLTGDQGPHGGKPTEDGALGVQCVPSASRSRSRSA
jgi:hypothetical protein